MKRLEVVFVTAVFTALLTGFLLQRSRRAEPFREEFSPPERPVFEPLETPWGTERLEGSVRTPEGAPAAGATVHVYPDAHHAGAEPRPIYWDTTDGEGRFEIEGLPAGRLEVVLLAADRPNTVLEVDVPSDEVRWVLPPPREPLPELPEIRRATLEGRLGLPEGVPGRERSLEGYEIVLVPAEDTPLLSGAMTRRTVTDPAGSFALHDVVEAGYTLQVLPAWARGGSWPILTSGTVHPGAGAEPVFLRLQTGEVMGTLLDSARRPIEGGTVRIWPSDLPDHTWPAESTDAQGAFRFGDLPDGSYVVQAHVGGATGEEWVIVRPGTQSRVLFPPFELRPPGAQD